MKRTRAVSQPRQKLAYSSKSKNWRIQNMDYADNFSFYNNERIRSSLRNKIINLNLYNGKLDMGDLASVVNPYGMEASFVPNKIPHNSIIVPKIDLLVGEEMKRVFDWNLLIVNDTGISEKQEAQSEEIMDGLIQMLQSGKEEEEIEIEMNRLEKYMKFEWKDHREKMSTQILKHYWHEQNFRRIFNECFKDALIFGEEVVQIEIVNNEPVLTKLNPMKVHTVRSGNSNKMEDANLIIIEDHWSPGKIVDYFHEDLKSSDIDHIMDYNDRSSTGDYSDDHNNHNLLKDALDHNGEPFMDDIFSIAEVNGHHFSSTLTDDAGNIRVFRVYWKSLKKAQKVKFYDEFGEEQYKFRTEEYIVDKDMGEEATTIWINEMWEGTKIGKDIYINMKPKEIQYNKVNNPSYCHAGIIGQVYNTNQGQAVSLIDRTKGLQYLYDVMWDRLNKAISTNYGKIFELDLAKVPENWEIEKWLHFATVNKIAVVDSFKEGNRGASTGKLAGGMNTQGGRSIDMETGAYIQQHVSMLEFIKQELSEIAGVSKQREGQISNRETVGGVERSVNQSANITEYWFGIHEDFKIRVLTAFLETAKVALRGNNKKVQYILDDLSIETLNIDGDEISEADYGIFVTNSHKSVKLEQMIDELAQSYVQNGGSMATLMDIAISDSLADKRRKLQSAEDEMQEEARQAQESEQEAMQAQTEAQMQDRQQDRDLKDLMNQRDNETRRYVVDSAAMQNSLREDDGIMDSETSEKISLDKLKIDNDKELKERDMDNDMSKHKDNIMVEKQKIAKMAKKASK